MPRLKVKILITSDYLLQTRNLKIGQIHNVIKVGQSAEKSKGTCYLIEPVKGKPIVMYDNEVEVSKNPL